MTASAEEFSKTASQFRLAGFLGSGLAILTCGLWLSGLLPGFHSGRDPNVKVIAGMSADNLLNNLAERGFTITRDFHANNAICKRDRYTVDIAGLSGGVTSVTVTVEADASSADHPFEFDDRKLMGYIASTSFTDAKSAENTHWAELHFEDSAERIDAGTTFQTKKEAAKRIMIIRPADQAPATLQR